MLCDKELGVIAVKALDPHDERIVISQGPSHPVPALRGDQDVAEAWLQVAVFPLESFT